ncbi:hypothetical protein GDO81_012722, partial [Engystomops pustulosus]
AALGSFRRESSAAVGEVLYSSVVMATAVDISEDIIQTISIKKETSLGLSLAGGISTAEGPLIQIKSLIPGGDCHKDGRLRAGDRLVSVNREPLIGVSCEEAKSILNRVKLRKCSFWDISFIRSDGEHSDSASSTATSHLLPKMSSTPNSSTSNPPSQSGNLKERRGSAEDASLPGHHQGHNQPKGISLRPDVRLKVDKLEMALRYLGINLTPEQRESMRSHMDLDADETVCYGDFIQVAKEMLKLQLEEGDLGQYIMTGEDNRFIDSVTSQIQSINLSHTDDMSRMRSERDDLCGHIKSLKEQLQESEKRNTQLSAELRNVQKVSGDM